MSTPTGDQQIQVRLPAAMLRAIDSELDKSRAAMPHIRLTRSDVVRTLIAQGLNSLAEADDWGLSREPIAAAG